MKRILSILFALLTTVPAAAQISIREDFEGSARLDWQEFSDKETGSMLIQAGYLELKSFSKEHGTIGEVLLPIVPEYDFTIEATIRIPKLDDHDRFGITIDCDEEFRRTMFLFSEGRADLFIVDKAWKVQTMEPNDSQRIKLKGGRDRTVEMKLERRGQRYILSADGVKLFERVRSLTLPLFGFYTENSCTLRIDRFSVTQSYTGEESE